MYEDLKSKIIILSSPRTGSTALFYDILNFFQKKNINLVQLNEPDIVGYAKTYAKDKSPIKDSELKNILENKDFILKVHARHLETQFPKFVYNYINNNNVSIIKIKRKDFLAQCLSMHISRHTNNWVCDKENNRVLEELLIPINENAILNSIYIAKKYNESLDNIQNYTICLNYEDCIFDHEQTVKNSKVKNYEDLKNTFQNLITEHYGIQT